MTLPEPAYARDGITIYHGECEDLFPALRSAGVRVDAIIADPPYCSGGTAREATSKTPAQKYVLSGTDLDRPDFSGDQRDQDSLRLWCAQWMRLAQRLAKPRCYLASFIDTRNLAVMIQAVQMGGWRFTDVIPWDKTLGGCRPSKGWFRKQREFAVIGRIGSLGPEQMRLGKCHDGLLRVNRSQEDKARHMHAKPVAAIKGLLGPAADIGPSALILDPFMGGGSSMLAARELGLQAIGIEREAENIDRAIALLSGQLNLSAALPPADGG